MFGIYFASMAGSGFYTLFTLFVIALLCRRRDMRAQFLLHQCDCCREMGLVSAP